MSTGQLVFLPLEGLSFVESKSIHSQGKAAIAVVARVLQRQSTRSVRHVGRARLGRRVVSALSCGRDIIIRISHRKCAGCAGQYGGLSVTSQEGGAEVVLPQLPLNHV